MGKQIEVGDYVQWTIGGADQFKKMLRVNQISECGEYLFVQSSSTGIPVSQISRVFSFTHGIKDYEV